MSGLSSETPKWIVPVLAGGGTRLPAHIGALKALQELGVNFQHIVGISGGSIVAALYASGLSLEKIRELAYGVDFRQFRGFSLYQLLFHGGLSSGHRFETWLSDQIGDICFADVGLGINIVASDVNSSKPVVFNRKTTPQMRLADAVRCSMGIPLIFSFRQRNEQVLVDGSILAEGTLRQDWSGEGHPVFFFRIRSNGYQRSREQLRPSLPRFIAMVIRTFMISLSQEYIHDAWWNSTIVIDSGEISPVEFSIPLEDKEFLYQTGYQTTINFLPVKLSR